MLKKIIAGSLLSVSMLFASNAEININNETVEVAGEFSLNESYALNEDANYYFTASYLSSEVENAHSDSPSVTSAGLKMVSPYIDDFGFKFGLGIKGVIAKNYSKDFAAVPLNLFAKFEFNSRLSFDGEINYAPKVLAFLDAESYRESKIKANFQVIDNGFVFVGKRMIETEYTNGVQLEYDDNIFFGYKVHF